MQERPSRPAFQIRTRLVVIATLLWLGAMTAVHSLWFEPMAGGRKAPDLLPFGYDLATFAAWREALGEAGRAAFLTWHTRGLDLIFPFLLTLALLLLLTDILSAFARFRAMPGWAKTLAPAVLAAPYGVVDLMENAAVAAMLDGSQAVDAANVAGAESLTVLKFAAIALPLLIAGVLATVAYTSKSGART